MVKSLREVIHLKYKICVVGAQESGHCHSDALNKARVIGAEIVKNDGVLITGVTTGVPYWVAKGAKEAGGFVIGISPALSEQDHIKNYKLPIDYYDTIIYTGFEYSGRNLLLSRAADAIIIVCGRMGTLNAFTIAFEDNKIIGVLTGTGGTADMISEIVEKARRGPGKIIYNSDPKNLISKVVDEIKKEHRHKHGEI